jgi:hypothetical protein
MTTPSPPPTVSCASTHRQSMLWWSAAIFACVPVRLHPVKADLSMCRPHRIGPEAVPRVQQGYGRASEAHLPPLASVYVSSSPWSS